jgi:transposase InsO family protein
MARQLQTSRTAPNILAHRFRAFGPRKILLTDITYSPLALNKYSYLSIIMDAYTKEILAYVFSPSLEVDFVLDTVGKARCRARY